MHQSRPCLPAETPHQTFERLTLPYLAIASASAEKVAYKRGIYAASHKSATEIIASHKSASLTA
jgi:hypothetical protein